MHQKYRKYDKYYNDFSMDIQDISTSSLSPPGDGVLENLLNKSNSKR